MRHETYCELTHKPSNTCEEGSSASRGRVVHFLNISQQRHWLPDDLAIHVLGGTGDEDAKHGSSRGGKRATNPEAQFCCAWSFGVPGPVGMSNAHASIWTAHDTDSLEEYKSSFTAIAVSERMS